jgi:hypothetical protein
VLCFFQTLWQAVLCPNHPYGAFFKAHLFVAQGSFDFLEVLQFIFLYHQEAWLSHFSHLHSITF